MDGFFDDVIVNGKEWSGGEQGPLRGSHIFVCAHGSRDVRCGVCGPVLIDKFNEQIQLRGLKDRITVAACSHVGGHKYAGNVIIFCSEPDGTIRGHWLVFSFHTSIISCIASHSYLLLMLYTYIQIIDIL